MCVCPQWSIKKFGFREEYEVAGFFGNSHLWVRGYFRLGKVNECPAGLEPSTGARRRRKATVKTRWNLHLIRNFIYYTFNSCMYWLKLIYHNKITLFNRKSRKFLKRKTILSLYRSTEMLLDRRTIVKAGDYLRL